MRKFCTIVLILVIGASCKKDHVSPGGARNFTLLNFSVDGRSTGLSLYNVSINPHISISFSDKLDRQSAESSIVLSGPSSSIPTSISYEHNDSTVVIVPSSSLNPWTKYQVVISDHLETASKKQFGAILTFNLITQIDTTDKFPRIADDALLDLVQKQTLKYFWDFGHPASGMARERNSSENTVTTGGSGFGLMAMVAGVDRGFIPRQDGIARFTKVVGFLETADRFHGAWPHWIDGNTGKVIPFGSNDDGADLVETSFMIQGLLTLRQYLQPADTVGNNLINRINKLWTDVEWDWFRRCDPNCHDVIYWHWSPDKGWIMNFALSGYFEEQITYFLAEASPTHSITADIYDKGFAQNGAIKTGQTYTYNNESHVLYLGTPSPLFWVQYSYLGLDPHFSDAYANYWDQNVNASLINHAYCVANPHHYAGYSDSFWGLTASDNPDGYDAQSPANDNGTVSPTAALSSFPYTPVESMKALKFFYYTLGDRLLGPYGFYDAINLNRGWVASSTLAIDQGPIVVMIENYRTGLLWNLFMSAPEVQAAKTKLNFH